MKNISRLFDKNKNDKYIFLILLIAAIVYIWNAFTLPFGSGYDELGHAAYIRKIATTGIIPPPLSGWTTFHPPLYYLLSSLIWKIMESSGPIAVILCIRMISCLSIILAGLLSYVFLKKLNFTNSVSLLSTSILLSLPAAMMAASWIGNEAFTALTSSIACVASVLLAQKQDDDKLAFFAGILSGLAFASKYTGLVIVFGLFAATYNLSTRRFRIRTITFAILGLLIISTPVVLRNISTTSSILPMTRSLAPIERVEAHTHITRSIKDYVTFNYECLLDPRIYNYKERQYNSHMDNVWGLTYVGLWFDPFGHRLPVNTSFGMLNIMPWLGLCPTFIMLVGLVDVIKDFIKKRLSQEWFPLLTIAIFELIIYIYWTWHSATLVAVKGSYLLPLIIPAASFFARGLQKITGRIRIIVITVCIITISVNIAALVQELIYYTPYDFNSFLSTWIPIAQEMPSSGIYETIKWFVSGL